MEPTDGVKREIATQTMTIEIDDSLPHKNKKYTTDSPSNARRGVHFAGQEKAEATYWDYLQLDKILDAQDPENSGGLHHHDEHLFIVTHQAFELWFKQILHDLDSCVDLFVPEMLKTQENVNTIVSRMNRANEILRYTLGFFDLLQTMSSNNFLLFRDFISPASGFQSVQFRELEMLFGVSDSDRKLGGICPFMAAQNIPEVTTQVVEGAHAVGTNGNTQTSTGTSTETSTDAPEGKMSMFKLAHEYPFLRNIIIRRHNKKSLLGSLETWLLDADVPSNFKAEFLSAKLAHLEDQFEMYKVPEKTRVETREKEMDNVRQNIDIDTVPNPTPKDEKNFKLRLAALYYSNYPHINGIYGYDQIIDCCLALEEAMLIWKNRHARLVERMIGRRRGTGGSLGVSYLDATTRPRIFKYLWEVRAILLRPDRLPHLDTTTDKKQFF